MIGFKDYFVVIAKPAAFFHLLTMSDSHKRAPVPKHSCKMLSSANHLFTPWGLKEECELQTVEEETSRSHRARLTAEFPVT